MATIRTSIMVHDGMSMALRHMNSAVQTMVSSFEQMHSLTDEPVNTRQFEAVQREIALATKALDQFEMEAKQVTIGQSQMNQHLSSGASMFKKLGGAVIGAVGAYVSFQQVSKLVDFATGYSNTIARIAMMNDGLQTTGELQQMIYQAAQDSLSSYETTAALVTRIGNNAANAFSSSSEIVDFAELIQKQFNIAGASAMEASNSTLQLTQALAAGTLRGEELNSILDQAPNIIQNIADYLDVPMGAIKGMASEGEITARIVKEAMFAAADDINQKFDSMPLTWSDIWTKMVNYAQNRAAGLALRISDFFNSEAFQTFKMAATQAVDIVVMGLHLIIMTLSSLANWVATVGQFFADNWTWVAPVLIMISVVLAGIATMIGVGIVTSVWAWAKAQWAVNAAFLANPMFWGIIALIALIAFLVYAIYAWGDSFANVVGFVAGLLFMLGAYIYNQVAYWWNIIAAFWEFFANVGRDRVYATKRLFYNLASNFIDKAIAMSSGWDGFATNFANAVISAVNIAIRAWNWFIGLLPDGVSSTIGLKAASEYAHTTSITNDLSRLKGSLNDWLGDTPADYWEAPKMDLISLGGAFGKGFEWGHNLSMGVTDSLNGLVDKASEYLNYDYTAQESALADLLNGLGLGNDNYMSGLNDTLNGLGDAIRDGNGAAKDTAANTGKLADAAKLSQEDLKYLRDQAASDSDNRYHNTIVKIDMRNENHINNDMDIDGIVEQLAVKTEEALGTLGEGV